MIILKPDYYNEFSCIASDCPDTCCMGWQIVIDEESIEKYKTVDGYYKDTLDKNIDWEEEVFYLDKQKRCAFLTNDNLCDMYRNLGKDSLCKTCRTYPRHIEEFENIREINLSLSCPEVARIIINKKEPVFYLSEENEDYEEFEEFDPFLFSCLEDTRNTIIGILQNRNWSISVRVALVWKIALEVQGCIDEEELFSYNDVLERYENASENDLHRVEEDLEKYHSDIKLVYDFSKLEFGKLYELELLCDEWDNMLNETWTSIYDVGYEAYRKICKEFKYWCDESFDNMDIIVEQILVYFIYTYMCGAVYDGNLFSKLKMSIMSALYIKEIFMAKWWNNKKSADIKEIISISYRYSRELEHSDLNLDILEKLI